MPPATRDALTKIGKGAAIAGLGAAAAVGLAELQMLDFGPYQALIGMVLSIAVNALNQWNQARKAAAAAVVLLVLGLASHAEAWDVPPQQAAPIVQQADPAALGRLSIVHQPQSPCCPWGVWWQPSLQDRPMLGLFQQQGDVALALWAGNCSTPAAIVLRPDGSLHWQSSR